jgi:hypothetical protein
MIDPPIPIASLWVLWFCGLALQLGFVLWVFWSVWRIQNSLADSVEASRQQVVLQREANQLLRELASQLRQPKPNADSTEDWPTPGEYVIGPTD